MVQFMKSTNLGPEPETTAMVTPCRDKLPVKLEIEDSLEEEHGPLNKRSKPSQSFQEVLIFFFFLACLVSEKTSETVRKL